MSRANGWYFVRIDDEWRPVEWVDGQFDASPMLCALILEVDESPISIAMHAENRQLRAKLAELEAQAAIGRRAVAWMASHGRKPDWHDYERCVECGYARGHKPGCDSAAILRDAGQAGVGVES